MSSLRMVVILSGALLAAHERAWASGCALPVAASAGFVAASKPYQSLILTVGPVSGVARSTGTILSLGYPARAVGAYQCFLSTEPPGVPLAMPGTRSVMRLVPSPAPTMQLEWMPAASDLPISYEVYFGSTPLTLSKIVSGLSAQSETQSALTYVLPYYWQVSAVDPFGRSAMSPIYSFSIAPVVDHAISAPNPFHPGYNSAAFMFSMPGPGSVKLEIYSLPDGRRVLERRLDGFQDGVNVYTYDGRDAGGRLLPNGVYVVRLIKEGSRGHSVESFKIVSAR